MDIMNKKFTIERNLTKTNNVKIPLNTIQTGTSIRACLICQKSNSYQVNIPMCAKYVMKPQPIKNARCKEDNDQIRFEFDNPNDKHFVNVEVDIEPAVVYSLPRILSKNMNHMTFTKLTPGKSYKIKAKTLAGPDEVVYSDPVELICTTKKAENVQAINNQLRSRRSNYEEDEMLLMIQSQTAIMKLVIMMTLVVLIILVMSTFTLSFLLRLKRQQVTLNFKPDCELGDLNEYRKL